MFYKNLINLWEKYPYKYCNNYINNIELRIAKIVYVFIIFDNLNKVN